MKIYLFTYKGYHPNEETEKEVINRIKLKKNLYKNDDYLLYENVDSKNIIKRLSKDVLRNSCFEIWKELEI